jgi:hypothetical protein
VQLEPRIPGLFWRLPFSQELYNLVVPAEDENQVRCRDGMDGLRDG